MIASREGALVKVTSPGRIALALCLVLGTSLPAMAGKDDARRFFTAAQKAFQAGRYVEAAKAFEEAFRIKPHPFPLINAGDAWEKAGELALAARTYQRVLVLEQSGEQDRADATERLAKLTPKLGTIELEGDASTRARVDEDEFKGGDRVYVVPGEHVVTLLDVDGAKERKVDLAAGVSRSVALATLMPGNEEPDSGPVKPDEGGTSPEPGHDEGPTKKGGVRAPTLIAFGVAAAAAGAGVYFGLQVNDAEKKYNDNPNRDDYDRFNKSKLFANVGFGVAIVGAGVGTFLLIKDLNRKVPAESARVHRRQLPVTIDVAPLSGGGFVMGSGHF
jgi:tetratricopeptide (TPR) repeat protein